MKRNWLLYNTVSFVERKKKRSNSVVSEKRNRSDKVIESKLIYFSIKVTVRVTMSQGIAMKHFLCICLGLKDVY